MSILQDPLARICNTGWCKQSYMQCSRCKNCSQPNGEEFKLEREQRRRQPMLPQLRLLNGAINLLQGEHVNVFDGKQDHMTAVIHLGPRYFIWVVGGRHLFGSGAALSLDRNIQSQHTAITCGLRYVSWKKRKCQKDVSS